MKRVALLLVVLGAVVLAGCSNTVPDTIILPSTTTGQTNISMTCSDAVYSVGLNQIYRCENDEVMCYVYNGTEKGGITCEWK